MPYLDKEKQKQAQHESYLRNKSKVRERSSQRKRGLQIWFQEYKRDLKCSKCPENHPACLDFHHKNPDEKEYEVCFMASKGSSKEQILKEIAKCDVLCANCHRKHHYDEKMASRTIG